MRKLLSVALVGLTTLACQPELTSPPAEGRPTEAPRAEAGAQAERSPATLPNSEVGPKSSLKGRKVNIDYLKACGSRGISGFRADTLSLPGKVLNDSLSLSSLQRISIQPSENWFFQTNEHESAYCYQWEEYAGYFYFTLMQDDEVCCRSVYLGMADSAGNLLAFTVLALRGGDGYWHRQDSVQKIGPGQFVLHQHNFEDEDTVAAGRQGFTSTHFYYQLVLELSRGGLSLDTLDRRRSDSTTWLK